MNNRYPSLWPHDRKESRKEREKAVQRNIVGVHRYFHAIETRGARLFAISRMAKRHLDASLSSNFHSFY